MEKVYKLIGVWWLMFIKIGLHLSVVFNDGVMGFIKGIQRSEERRVGKEC